jgi:CubicO group peptidase (beta-lactamase class C family)
MFAHLALFALALQQTPDSAAAVDRVFASWTNTATPGCAVGVARGGKTILTRAYGMANLEYDVPNTPATIFEGGSVSKQFTAAAVTLLALDGKLSLEDPIRKYFPELPPYGDSITIRQMLNHTSGLRDWGTVAAAGGWPRGTRTYTQTHVLDILARQKSLNYKPGAEYLYSNSNYNLSAMLVERVSGMPFPEFTRKRLFEPLGMTHTSWRDDYTRVVKNRSTAYAAVGNQTWRQDMPFENVFGNSSLLTTVEDLLKWNENFTNPTLGGPRFVSAMHTQGRLNNGRTITYALGVVVDNYRGVREINHTGATAGYRAYLGRFPDQQLSVALLCNSGSVNPGAIGHQVAEVFLQGQLAAVPRQAAGSMRLTAEALQARTGVYRQELTGQPMRIIVRDSTLRLGNTALTPTSESVFAVGTSGRIEFLQDGRRARLVSPDADTLLLTREPAWTPTAAELAQYAGRYSSDEAEAWFTVAVKDGKLLATDRYGSSDTLVAVYKDAFTQSGQLVTFRRSASGTVNAVSLGLGRVRDLRFAKR